MARYHTRGEDALTAALHEAAPDAPELAARLAAGQILVALRTLGARQPGAHRRRQDGRRAGPGGGRAEAELAFDQLRSGLARYR